MEGIGNILYSVISEIGKEKIQSDITLNIELSRRYSRHSNSQSSYA
jgi:hypothetical protein